jgi:hypothetical protein
MQYYNPISYICMSFEVQLSYYYYYYYFYANSHSKDNF